MSKIEFFIGAVMFAVLAFALTSMDGFEALYELSRAHEDWELDEIILLVTAGVIGVLAILVLRARRRTSEIRTARADLQKRFQELEQAKAELEEANQHKTRFLSLASHELRTPLNAIIGFAQVLSSDSFSNISEDQRRIYVRDIEDAGLRLLQQVNGMLQLSTIGSNEYKLKEEPVDVVEAVRFALTAVSGVIEDQSLQTRYTPDPNLPALYGDARLVRQVIFNLLSNAAKFNRQGGAIGVDIRINDDGGLVITVSDTGEGIPQEEIRLLTEPYGQAVVFPKMASTSAGFGLPISAAIMRLHAGSLDIVGDPGKGTTATAIFPADRVLSG